MSKDSEIFSKASSKASSKAGTQCISYNQNKENEAQELAATQPQPHQTSTQNQNHQTSVSSNFMSERTINLKKEITSLDEEISALQNNLKAAIIHSATEDD